VDLLFYEEILDVPSKYVRMKKASVLTWKSRSVNRLYCEVKRWIDESGTKMQ
jgi:hypothetical protein